MIHLALLVVILFVGPAAANPGGSEGVHQRSQDREARELLSRAYENMYSGEFVQIVRLTTRQGSGTPIARRMQIVRSGRATEERVLIRLLGPDELRGTSTLILRQEHRDDDVFMYLPAFRLVRRISSSQRSDSFLGSDLAYEDFEPRRAEDFDVEFAGRDVRGGRSCTRILTRPKPLLRSAYETVEVCVDDRRPVVLWASFGRGGREIKQLEIDPDSLREVDSRWVPFRAHAFHHTRQTETRLEIESYISCARIPDSVFAVPNLERGDPENDRRKAIAGH